MIGKNLMAVCFFSKIEATKLFLTKLRLSQYQLRFSIHENNTNIDKIISIHPQSPRCWDKIDRGEDDGLHDI